MHSEVDGIGNIPIRREISKRKTSVELRAKVKTKVILVNEGCVDEGDDYLWKVVRSYICYNHDSERDASTCFVG